MQSEEEREPTLIVSTNKGKGREIDLISVIDQHGEQLEANSRITFVPLQGHHTLKPLASPKDRHIAKSEDQLRGTQNEEMENNENIVTTLQGKKIDIEDLNDTSDKDDNIPFASTIASINPDQPNLVASLVLGCAYEPRGVGFVNVEGVLPPLPWQRWSSNPSS